MFSIYFTEKPHSVDIGGKQEQQETEVRKTSRERYRGRRDQVR